LQRSVRRASFHIVSRRLPPLAATLSPPLTPCCCFAAAALQVSATLRYYDICHAMMLIYAAASLAAAAPLRLMPRLERHARHALMIFSMPD